MSGPSSRSASNASSWAVYRRILEIAKQFWPLGVVALIGMVLEAGAAGAFTSLMQPLIDDMMIARNAEMMARLPWMIVAIFLVRGIATFASDYGMARIGRSVVRVLRDRLMAKYLTMPQAFFDRGSTSQLVSRLTYNTEQITQSSAEAIKIALTDTLTIIAMLGVMMYHSWRLTITMFVIGPLIAAIVYWVGRRYRRINQRIQESVGEMMHSAHQTLAASSTVKVYGASAQQAARFGASAERNLVLNVKVALTRALSSATVQLLAAVALAIIVFMAGREALQDRLSAGAFTSLITTMMAMLPSIKRITNVQSMIQKGVAAAADIFEVLDCQAELDTGNPIANRVQGRLVFESVDLQYESSDKLALQHISFIAEPGTMTALVGRSGGGKSSVVKLIPRFYAPKAGRITLDGEALGDLNLSDLRRQIALVSQDVMLFDDTIAANIAFGELQNATLAQIEAAARASHAWEFIDTLPLGLQTRLGENGVQLSGGQRQRIALARAFLKDAPILILDEATSALDNASERLVQDAIKQLMHGRTVLVIAHRLSTIEHADQVLVLDEGRLVERGNHASLISHNGVYARLHQLQFREPATSTAEN